MRGLCECDLLKNKGFGGSERELPGQLERHLSVSLPGKLERQRAPACYWSQPAAQYCLGAKSTRQSRNTNKYTKIFILRIDGDNKDLYMLAQSIYKNNNKDKDRYLARV